MSHLEQFQRYADAFEVTYDDDDWSRIAPYFADDAVYRVKGLPFMPVDARGRDAVLGALKAAIDRFDRRCAKRELALNKPPALDGDTVTIDWSATYRLEGADDLVFEGIETARYNAAGEIVELVDKYGPEMAERAANWFTKNGPALVG